jgi:hypothetical protein
VEHDTGSQPLRIPDGWLTKPSPARLFDTDGTLRVQAGDLVHLDPNDPADPALIQVLKRPTTPPRPSTAPLTADGQDDSFLSNLRRALRCWRIAPLLPAVSLLFAAASALPSLFAPRPSGCGSTVPCDDGDPVTFVLLSLLVLPVSIAGLGFLGAERLWYAQIYQGNRPYPSWAIGQLWHMIGRFLRLGLLIMCLFVPIGIVLRPSADQPERTVAVIVLSIATDTLLTFVTPALAFTTSSAFRAIRIGLRELVRGMPGDLPYALVPPLAATLVLRTAPSLGTPAVNAALGMSATLLTLLFAGATAFRYLQRTAEIVSQSGRGGGVQSG